MNIPVWHDDQLGTAGATLAGLLNALKLTGRNERDTKIVIMGSGAANIATIKLLDSAGFDIGNIIAVDSHGVLHPEREDMDVLMKDNPWKYDLGIRTNRRRITGDIQNALEGADVFDCCIKTGSRYHKG